MARFLGYRSVIADLRKHKLGTGKVVAATLTPHGAAAVSYANAYVWPQDQVSGLEGGGFPNTAGMVTLWRVGETTKPVVDDKLTVGGATVQVVRVHARLNADESRNFAVYDLSVV